MQGKSRRSQTDGKGYPAGYILKLCCLRLIFDMKRRIVGFNRLCSNCMVRTAVACQHSFHFTDTTRNFTGRCRKPATFMHRMFTLVTKRHFPRLLLTFGSHSCPLHSFWSSMRTTPVDQTLVSYHNNQELQTKSPAATMATGGKRLPPGNEQQRSIARCQELQEERDRRCADSGRGKFFEFVFSRFGTTIV